VSKKSELKELSDVVKLIKDEVGRLLGTNITVAIVDSEGDIKYIDNEIKKFSEFVISFVKGNFTLLSPGDHSLPLSGTNIAFFKISEKALIILNSEKGPVGQLLAFKGRMQKYAEKIDKFLEAAIVEEETKASAKAAVRVPVLTVSISNKKFGMEEAKVLHLINGENTVSDICERTGIPQLKVDEILRRYQKKGWIKLKRLIVGFGKEEEAEIEMAPQPIPPQPLAATTEKSKPQPISKAIKPPEFSQIPEHLPEMPSSPPLQPSLPSLPSKVESEETVVDDLMQLIETTTPIEELPTAEKVPRIDTSAVTPPPSTKSKPKEAVSVKMPKESAFTAPPIPKSVSKPVSPSKNAEMTEIKGEPVTDSLFNELSSLLDKTKPISPSSIEIPEAMPSADEGAKTTISGDSLLQETETEEGVKITVYPEEDPLKSRLERLSNILEETTADISTKAEKEGVEIQGSKAVCPNCRSLVTIMSKVCPNCQHPLRICPNCNAAITLFARICPACGSLL